MVFNLLLSGGLSGLSLCGFVRWLESKDPMYDKSKTILCLFHHLSSEIKIHQVKIKSIR